MKPLNTSTSEPDHSEVWTKILPDGTVVHGTDNDLIIDLKCTCDERCHQPCKGTCGCEACHTCYQDFLSSRVD